MKFKAMVLRVGIVGALLMYTAVSFAAVLPGAANPELVTKALQQQQRKPPPPTLPPLQTKPEEGPPISPEAKKIKFHLTKIILVGNHVYSEEQLLPLYQSKLNRTISVADLFALVQDITNYYRNNGYILSRAILPPQHIKSGAVKVEIIEGYIHSVDIMGRPRGAYCYILRLGQKLTYCRPISIISLERYMLLANETPGTVVKSVLQPAKGASGASDISLVVDNRPITGYISYDNYGTRYIGPQQMTANVALNSFFVSGDSTQITFTKTPRGAEINYHDINYNMPINDEGVRWLIGVTNAHTHPMFILRPQNIRGINDNYYTNLTFPIVRTRSKSLNLRASFNYQDSHVTSLSQLLYNDHIRSVGFGLTYNFSDTWYGSNLINIDVRQGLPIFGYTSDTSILAKTSRPSGHAVYNKLAVVLSRLQLIKGPVSLYMLAMGQTTSVPLLSSEQFSYGGSQLGRGYDIAELVGDRGVAGTLELRYDLAVGKFYINAFQFYLFYDAGMIWNYNTASNIPTQPSLPLKDSATSFGVGVRFFFTKVLSGNVMWAQPLTRKVDTETQTEQVVLPDGTIEYVGNGWRPRVFFSIVAALD